MEKTLMNIIYNKLWDSREELEIDEIKIFENWEGNWVVSYKNNGEKYAITNEFIGY